ncbi:MAG: hypothetical protein LBL24_07510 [Bacteroidales bacterium]|jgi:phage terminase large subunit-like protein|nr:hypothetical protein [Bacteroidales bacterium]
MKSGDRKAVDRYLAQIELARSLGADVDPFETEAEKRKVVERMKRDPGYLAVKMFPHLCTCESADFQIEFARRVKSNPIFKGYAEWGRGLAKSVWADIIIPVWLWINGETKYMCLVSDTSDRACDLLDDLRAEFEANPILTHYFGEQKTEGYWEKGNFTTQSGFIAKAFGVRQKVRGLRKGRYRPDLWVVDDLETPQSIKNQKIQDDYVKWIERDVIPTMTGMFRRLIGSNNRFASRMVQTLLKERHPKWLFHTVAAYDEATCEPAWKAAYTADFYREQESDMGIIAAHAEYNHKAIPEGKIFSEGQIQWAPLPPLSGFTMIIAHWDIAYSENSTADYNAVRIWGLYNRNYWLIDCYVRQSKMRRAVDWMCDRQRMYMHEVKIYWQYEAQFWNDEVNRTVYEAETEHGLSLNLVKRETPHIKKLMRLVSMQPYYQNGRIYYSEALKSSHDSQMGIRQLTGIEPGSSEHDDSPDADQQAIESLEQYNAPPQKDKDTKSWVAGKIKQIFNLP